jgi:hypothetical protein
LNPALVDLRTHAVAMMPNQTDNSIANNLPACAKIANQSLFYDGFSNLLGLRM